MPVRTRKFLRPTGLALGIALSAGAFSALAENMSLTLDQAQMMAVQAIKEKRPKLAYQLSEGLLQADPRNGMAHFTQALAFAQEDAFDLARISARKAFMNAKTPEQKYEAANLASQMAYAGNHLTLSQLWLRRAAHHAPSEDVRKDTIKAFQTVRMRNPLNFNLKFSITPSDNVNNGANSPYNIIDGSPVVGSLSPSAQAIKGVVATLDLQGSYRLSRTERTMTRLTGRAYTRQVQFNNSVPGLSASDLGSTRLEIGLAHSLITPSKLGQWDFDLAGGRVWSGGDALYDFARTGVTRHQKLGERTRLSFGGSVEFQEDETWRNRDATQYQLFAQLGYRLDNGDRLGGYVSYGDTDTSAVNRERTQLTGIVSYTLGKAVGPASLSFRLGHSVVDYDTYIIGGTVIGAVPGGRKDNSTFGGVTASFDNWSYMGFVPTVSVNAEKTRSNISRFDVDETSVSFGIRSEF